MNDIEESHETGKWKLILMLTFTRNITVPSPLHLWDNLVFSLTSYIRESLNFTNESDHLLYLIIYQVKTLTPKEVSFAHVNNASTF